MIAGTVTLPRDNGKARGLRLEKKSSKKILNYENFEDEED